MPSGRLATGLFTCWIFFTSITKIVFVFLCVCVARAQVSHYVNEIIPHQASRDHMLSLMGGPAFAHYGDGLSGTVPNSLPCIFYSMRGHHQDLTESRRPQNKHADFVHCQTRKSSKSKS
jgi:hypothetical protein